MIKKEPNFHQCYMLNFSLVPWVGICSLKQGFYMSCDNTVCYLQIEKIRMSTQRELRRSANEFWIEYLFFISLTPDFHSITAGPLSLVNRCTFCSAVWPVTQHQSSLRPLSTIRLKSIHQMEVNVVCMDIKKWIRGLLLSRNLKHFLVKLKVSRY